MAIQSPCNPASSRLVAVAALEPLTTATALPAAELPPAVRPAAVSSSIRAGSITGSGTINANGTNANISVLIDASGGGAGAVLVFSSAVGGSVGSLTVNARCGNGGNNAGTGGGSYDRTGDSTTFTFSGDGSSGIAFADVPENRFLSENTVSTLPGAVVFHTHSFTAGSDVSVTFTTTAVASPALPGWSDVLYRDTNCSGSFDNGEPQITLPLR